MTSFRDEYDRIIDQCWQDGNCFLCGADFRSTEHSVEDIFPKWLMNAYGLWDKKASLNNGTFIRYRDLRIRACRTCNNVFLSKVENRIRDAVIEKSGKLHDVDDLTLATWMAKVLVACHVKAVKLPMDRKNPEGTRLLDISLLDRQAHFFLQAVRGLVAFGESDDSVFASVFCFRCVENDEYIFDFVPNFLHSYCAVKFRREALIVVFDGGAQALLQSHLDAFRQRSIHNAAQFREVISMIHYFSEINLCRPVYQISETTNELVVSRSGFLPREIPEQIVFPDDTEAMLKFKELSQSITSRPLFGKWSTQRYTEIFSEYTGAAISADKLPEGTMPTCF